jgi:two-component system sensor histidine kinase/response regulator
LAEDNPVNQRVALHQLARLGYAADAVGNGREAVAAVAQVPYDLVLMDCQMPDMDGYQATSAIRGRENGGPRIPIIALTASALDGEMEKCLSAGMDAYLSKPVKMDELRTLLAQWLPDRPPCAPADVSSHRLLDPAVMDRLRETLGPEADDVIDTTVSMFFAHADQHLHAAHDAAARGDARRLGQLAHGIKGSALQLGAERMVQIAARLEQAAHNEALDEAPALVTRLTETFTETRKALRRLGLGLDLTSMQPRG